MIDERRRGGHALSGQQVLEFERVHTRFGLKMIIRDHIRDICLVSDALNLLFPSRNFGLGVEIVVAVIPVIAIEPLIVVASVQTHIAERRGHMFGGLERAPDQRLIDIAESNVLAREVSQRFRIIPA